MNSFPQVLLLGNGINLAYGGVSWKKLMGLIKTRDDLSVDDLKAPMPMQAILVTNNNLKDAMKQHSKSFFGEVKTKEQAEVLNQLLNMGFDDILTTNYSYELEEAALGSKMVSNEKLKKINERTCEKREDRYFLHTYNKVPTNNGDVRVWHIHGEARKPDSMMLGHYWYGNMLGRIQSELQERKNKYAYRQEHNLEIEYDSWVDSFILGDIYIIGFGFDLTELDLWWLLNRKARERADKGKVYFYEPKSEEKFEKQALLKLMGVEIRDLGFEEDQLKANNDYKPFYREAIKDIKEMVVCKSTLKDCGKI